MKRLSLSILLALIFLGGCATDTARKSEETQSVSAAYTRLGLEYLQAGDTQSAKNALQKALSLAPHDAEAHHGLALSFQLEGEKALAEDYFLKATQFAPQSAMIHNNFGAFLFAEKRYELACSELARATEDPFYNRRSQAFENLGRCYRLLNKAEAAVHAFERALQISPLRVISLIELSDLLIEQKKLTDAERYFERFSEQVDSRRVQHYAKSLWVGVRLARYSGALSKAATYALILKNMFPDSEEYRLYEESAR
ncbi:MAG: type IV pilus biogenesis/stability protein PilW [Pontibacterium sp.]